MLLFLVFCKLSFHFLRLFSSIGVFLIFLVILQKLLMVLTLLYHFVMYCLTVDLFYLI